jgi:hypothetical protein
MKYLEQASIDEKSDSSNLVRMQGNKELRIEHTASPTVSDENII